MAEAVYFLCALTSLVCTILLARSYLRTRVRLLMWSSLCFLGLFLNNVLLLADEVIFPHVPLAPFTKIPALFGTAALLYALVMEIDP